MTWEHNGKRFNSECFLSDDGLIYDDIISNMRLYSESRTVQKIFPSIKTRSETGVGDTYRIVEHAYHQILVPDGDKSVAAAWATAIVVIVVDVKSNGTEEIYAASGDAYYGTEKRLGRGYNANAATSVYAELDKKSCKYSLAAGVSEKDNVQISIGPVNVSMSGHSQGTHKSGSFFTKD